MKHIGLFEGIGGFSLAAEWMGWETIAWCEWNKFCQKVLKHRFPNAIPHGDITKTDFTIYRGQCDILTGGFPCQPFSAAGEQLGEQHKQFLLDEMLRAISEIEPRWIVAENVFGITNEKFKSTVEKIYSYLENKGYWLQPFNIPASAVGCDHERQRIFFVAHSSKIKLNASITKNSGSKDGRFKEKEWSKGRVELKLVSGIGYTGIGFYDGENYQPAIIGTSDEFPNQLDELESYGNAVVPQVVLQIYKAIEQYERSIQ